MRKKLFYENWPAKGTTKSLCEFLYAANIQNNLMKLGFVPCDYLYVKNKMDLPARVDLWWALSEDSAAEEECRDESACWRKAKTGSVRIPDVVAVRLWA